MENRGTYEAGLWCVPVALIALFGAMGLLAGFLPPPSPALDAAETAAIYASHSFGIRITGVLTIWTAALLTPITGIISLLIWKSDPRNAPLAATQAIAGLMTIFPFILSGLGWALAAYRPDRDPQAIMLLNDFAWASLLMPTAPAIVQLGALGAAILGDRSARPLFPRWLAYQCFWVAMTFIPGNLLLMVKTGPFAWNGLLSFWVAAAGYGAWLICMVVMCRRAVRLG